MLTEIKFKIQNYRLHRAFAKTAKMSYKKES